MNSLSVLNCQPVVNYLSVPSRPLRLCPNYLSAFITMTNDHQRSFSCRWRSRCWEWPCGVCGQHTPSLTPLIILNSRPASLSHHLCTSPQHRRRCLLSAPLLTFGPPSVWWDRRGSASLHRQHGWRIPCLRLQPLSPGLRFGLSTQRLHHGTKLPPLRRGPSVHLLRWAPSSLRLCLGQSLTIRYLGTPIFLLCLVPPSLQLCQAPISLRLHRTLPDPRFHLGH